ncbi:MAG: hypothetical protein KAU21_12030, partial [Gammaproteobacteria bacterium]|nr:hypothetical protein [Gammaproteobacteria bacterium]
MESNTAGCHALLIKKPGHSKVNMVTMELDLPWEEGREDRLFTRLVIVFIIIFLVIGIVFNNMPVPDIKKKQQVVVPPRLAKLILEKKKVPPPPLLEKVIKKEKPQKKEELQKEQQKPEVKKVKPKPEIKAEPKQKPKPKPVDTRTAAKKIAQKSGLNALSDEITDLRDSFDFSDIAQQPQLKTGKQALNV